MKNKFASANHFMKHGKEKQVLEILVGSVLMTLKHYNLHIRHPSELKDSEVGRGIFEAILGNIGEDKFLLVFAILSSLSEGLEEGANLTDIKEFNLLSWKKNNDIVNFECNCTLA
ncbi:hypothetical protein K6L09_20585 [Burkholderia cepacia]